MATDDASVRIRLEGRLELLEAARSRYRLLQLKVFNALRWKQAARRHAGLLRELAQAEPRVDDALLAVERLAASEGLKARSEAVQCAREVQRLRAQVTAKVAGLLDEALDGVPLRDRLLALENAAVHAPRLVLPGQRMATAVELLPASLPELATVAAFGAQLERVFKRPDGLGRALPFEQGELDALEAAWPKGEAALAAAWARVAAVDAAGTLTRYLTRLSRRMPMHPPKNGAEHLLFAEFWKTFGLARLSKLVAPRVSPLTVRPAELFPVARWLWAVERDGRARLSAVSPLSKARAALFELARELTAVAPGQDFSARAWERLEALAAVAEEVPADADRDALADNLRLLLRVLNNEKPRGRTTANDESLTSLVAALHDVAQHR